MTVNSWRPKGWENKYPGVMNYSAYEAGADAMLEALRKIGNRCSTPDYSKEQHPLINVTHVFIPDDEVTK